MHWILGSFGPLRAASRKAVWAFHSEIGRVFQVGAGFCRPALEVRRKYQILWFAVDLPHRQRYFFIYGCERTVKKTQRRGSHSNPLRAEYFGLSLSRPVSRALPRIFPEPGLLHWRRQGFYSNFAD